MTEQTTQDISLPEMPRCIDATVREFHTEMVSRLSALEARDAERIPDTQPIWQAIHKQTGAIDARLSSLESQVVGMVAENRAYFSKVQGSMDVLACKFDAGGR